MKKIFLLMAIVLPFVLISCGDDKDEPETPEEHEWVDLGLPSGTLWATCNIGADAPEEYGDYFAWGETEPKEVYSGDNYKWSSDYSKYNDTDNKTELELEDDVAYNNLGALWRIPSDEQFNELVDYCTWRWTQKNSVNGYLVTGPNRKTIFLPAAGVYFDGLLYSSGSHGYYWTRTRYPGFNFLDGFCWPVHLEFDSNDSYNTCSRIGYRTAGHVVRAVRVSRN